MKANRMDKIEMAFDRPIVHRKFAALYSPFPFVTLQISSVHEFDSYENMI
jgi:hypothetical protein